MKLDAIFCSNMVFAAKKPIRIYGQSDEELEITLLKQRKYVTPINGRWFVEFPPMEYGGPYEIKVSTNKETIILDNIYIGDVYLMAGQSNMQFKLGESKTPIEEYRSNSHIRLFSTERIEKNEKFTPRDGWKECCFTEIKDWSAIAYLTAKEINESKNIPIGVIACYQGASVIESWVPAGCFEKIGINLDIEEKHNDHTENLYSAWNRDGVLYEYALSQVFPFSISGVVWYQGESDTSLEEALVYKDELTELIKIWRKAFEDSALPFVVVQIADYDCRNDIAWKTVQKAQYDVQFELPHIKTVISSDVCESDDIHPPTKDVLAKRIAKSLNELIK